MKIEVEYVDTPDGRMPKLNAIDYANMANLATMAALQKQQAEEKLAATIAGLSPSERRQWQKEGLLPKGKRGPKPKGTTPAHLPPPGYEFVGPPKRKGRPPGTGPRQREAANTFTFNHASNVVIASVVAPPVAVPPPLPAWAAPVPVAAPSLLAGPGMPPPVPLPSPVVPPLPVSEGDTALNASNSVAGLWPVRVRVAWVVAGSGLVAAVQGVGAPQRTGQRGRPATGPQVTTQHAAPLGGATDAWAIGQHLALGWAYEGLPLVLVPEGAGAWVVVAQAGAVLHVGATKPDV